MILASVCPFFSTTFLMVRAIGHCRLHLYIYLNKVFIYVLLLLSFDFISSWLSCPFVIFVFFAFFSISIYFGWFFIWLFRYFIVIWFPDVICFLLNSLLSLNPNWTKLFRKVLTNVFHFRYFSCIFCHFQIVCV